MSLNEKQIADKLRSLFADVFNIQMNDIKDESSPDTIKNWDSLKHLELILALEEAFDISLSADEVIEMKTFKDIANLLNERLC